MRIVGKPRDSEIIPPGCSGFATIGPANLNFFRHQGAGLLSFAFEHGMVNRLTPGLNDELVSDPQRWLEAAQEKPGSWWPDWHAWMKHHSSGTIPAPTELGNAQYHPIEPAPGRYVKLKSN
jgi:hypothetical protein